MTKRVVFACNGSEDLFVAVPALAREHGAEIVTLALDIGQGEELEQVHQRALQAGALRAHVLDVREEFARDFVLPALQHGELRSAREPIALTLAHALVARKAVDVALIEDADAIAHHAVDTDRARIESSIRALSPSLQIVACNTPRARVTTRGNLWGGAIEYEDRAAGPHLPYALTTAADAAPETGADVELDFREGVPVAVNGVSLDLTELIESLSIIGGQHGVGRISAIRGRARHGSFRMYEAPAAAVLHMAHKALELATVPSELLLLKRPLRKKYVELAVGGLWFSDVREALDAFGRVVQRHVTGTVHLHLRKGDCTVSDVGRRQASTPARIADSGNGPAVDGRGEAVHGS